MPLCVFCSWASRFYLSLSLSPSRPPPPAKHLHLGREIISDLSRVGCVAWNHYCPLPVHPSPYFLQPRRSSLAYSRTESPWAVSKIWCMVTPNCTKGGVTVQHNRDQASLSQSTIQLCRCSEKARAQWDESSLHLRPQVKRKRQSLLPSQTTEQFLATWESLCDMRKERTHKGSHSS